MSEPSREAIAAKLLGVNPDTLHWSDYGYETQQHYLRMADVAIAALRAAKPERERVIEQLTAAGLTSRDGTYVQGSMDQILRALKGTTA